MSTSLARGAGAIYFGPFLVTPQVFHLTPLSFALVNLKPILPGHVLVSPRRVVARVRDLTPAETADLFLTTRRVANMVERVYGATSLNIAIQDGKDAGQSVPHVHTHIIPRKRTDLDHMGGTDAVYELMDGEEGDIGRFQSMRQAGRSYSFSAIESEGRKPRSDEEMRTEAEVLAKEMEKEVD